MEHEHLLDWQSCLKYCNFHPIGEKATLWRNPTHFLSVFDLRYDWLIFHIYGKFPYTAASSYDRQAPLVRCDWLPESQALWLWRRASDLRFRPFLRSVFRFRCLLRSAVPVPFRCRFSTKIRSSFRICYSMQFGVFPVSLRKICASTT